MSRLILPGILGVKSTIFSDYFLPSENELVLMYNNLKAFNVGNFSNVNYWSSTERASAPATEARRINFGGTGVVLNSSKNLSFVVRAARRFTLTESSQSLNLRDVGQAGGLIFHVINNGNGTYTYYEAAISNIEGTVWSNVINVQVGTSATVGQGINNTNAIVNQSGHTNSAALTCLNYTQEF
jgi:hypothetical protein